MEKGQIVEVKIEDMSHEGQGIGRADGLVVFVPKTVVGDVARAELTKVKKNYAFSRLVEIVEYSQDRDEEFDCEYFDKGCGGCPYGGIRYDAQLELKERQVREKLQRLAGIDSPCLRPIIGMEPDDNDGLGCYRYRNKAQFPVSTGGIITRKGGLVENLGEPSIGFYRAKSHEVVNCDDCYLQSMAAMAAADALRTFMEEDNITAYDPKWDKGLIRHLIVKTAFATGEVMVILVINGKGIPNASKLVEMLDDAIYEVGYSLESVVLNIKKSSGVKKARTEREQAQAMSGEIMGDENVVIAGKNVIRDVFGDLEFEISPNSFYQVNPVQMKRLYDKVKEYCGGEGVLGGERLEDERLAGEKPVILDLYCGVGTIGLYCADIAEAVVGIEIVKEAVIDANRNAVVNGIVNARYICGKAEELLPKYVAYEPMTDMGTNESAHIEMDKANLDPQNSSKLDPQIASWIKNAGIAILDPPRAGCRPELLEAVAAVGVNKIVYVSCDPATLARDIKLLGEMGYEFVEATPVDMFPGSSHVECVSLLQKVK
ncbi:MAG: 23S rRNA (uracil(1939)-C(5))-methyltransferase RlmD [Bacillota bacterium]|nr:23S rRNA (uracil(1939)-C(5))-methyltransferase RlmD [Bacillota bacterium]